MTETEYQKHIINMKLAQQVDVSIVMLSYNVEDYIKQAIEAIVSQETQYKFELTIFDDASRDHTQEIIREMAERYPEIVRFVLRKDNIGAQRNYYEALSSCTGRYCMYCDGDDYWLPGKIQRQVFYMDEHPEVGACSAQVVMVDMQTGQLTDQVSDYRRTDLESMLIQNNVTNVTTCARSELIHAFLEDVHPEQKDWRMGDYPVWLWFSKNSKIVATDDVFGAYRCYRGSLSHPSELKDNLVFTKSTYDVGMYYAQTEEQRNIVKDVYEKAVMENHWLFGDMSGFRLCYNNSQARNIRLKDRVKYVISYLPFAGSMIRKSFRGRL